MSDALSTEGFYERGYTETDCGDAVQEHTYVFPEERSADADRGLQEAKATWSDETDVILSRRSSLAGDRSAAVLELSRLVNRFCSRILTSLENGLHGTQPSAGHPSILNTSEAGRRREINLPGFSIPGGSCLSREEWLRLYSIAVRRMERFGYLMTQRDKKYISKQSGIDITPYIWNTLVRRMGLRRIENPYSSSNLVIYVEPRRVPGIAPRKRSEEQRVCER